MWLLQPDRRGGHIRKGHHTSITSTYQWRLISWGNAPFLCRTLTGEIWTSPHKGGCWNTRYYTLGVYNTLHQLTTGGPSSSTSLWRLNERYGFLLTLIVQCMWCVSSYEMTEYRNCCNPFCPSLCLLTTWCFWQLESMGCEVCGELYELYTGLVSQTPDAQSDRCFKTYLLVTSPLLWIFTSSFFLKWKI